MAGMVNLSKVSILSVAITTLIFLFLILIFHIFIINKNRGDGKSSPMKKELLFNFI